MYVYVPQDWVMYNMSGGNKWHCCGMRNCSLQGAKQSRNLGVVFRTSVLHLLRDDAVNGLYSSSCCVLFFYISSLVFPWLKVYLNATGMVQKTAATIDWVTWRYEHIVPVLRDPFFYCLQYFAHCIQWQTSTAGGLWGQAQFPQFSTSAEVPPLLHSPLCVLAFRKNIMARSVENHQPNEAGICLVSA